MGLIISMTRLSTDLAQAERYVEAYNKLVEEVGALVDRNALAEDEAERLRKFNAEILGHNNPAQRIMYVDRIRRELYETKQVCVISNHLPSLELCVMMIAHAEINHAGA